MNTYENPASDKTDRLSSLAVSLADNTVEIFNKNPQDLAGQSRQLLDLKDECVQAAFGLVEDADSAPIRDREQLFNALAENLPDFNTDALYKTRKSLLSVAAAVFLGWVFGGIVSSLLGLIGLGGEIMRPLFIFAFIWLEEYLCVNTHARNILLGCLGLAGLGRFALSVSQGLFRFTSLGAFSNAVLGGMRVNIFKSAWLLFGAFFVFIFLAKKVSGMDINAFRQSLADQIEQRLKIIIFILHTVIERDIQINTFEKKIDANSDLCPKSSCVLAKAVMDLLDSLDENNRLYLKEKLDTTGYRQASREDCLIWNEQRDGPLYETIGLIKNGDKCRILKQPYRLGEKIIKGHVQKKRN